MFESDTVLAYPLDLTRFLNCVGDTVHAGIVYCSALSVIVVSRAELPDYSEKKFELAAKAGQTKFKFITRKGEQA